MADSSREVEETVTRAGNTVQKTTKVNDNTSASAHNVNVAERIIWLIAGAILTLLAFRFLLSLLGANPENGFANLIYSLSYPFVAPFFGLFSYDDTFTGVGRFELYTLIAMAVYTVLAWAISKVVTLNKD